MTYEELESMLTDGLDDAAKAAVRAALNREQVKTKVGGLKAQAEFETIQQQATALRQELEGAPDKPGTRAYAKWYNDNWATIEANSKAIDAFEKKYGKGSFNAMATGTATLPDPNAPPAPGITMTKEEIARLAAEAADNRIRDQYAPQWSNLLTSTGTLVQKHMYAGRKTPIDFSAVAELAKKYNGDLNLAYDEWDKPEREKELKTAEDKRVEQRVQEELQKRGTTAHFPGGADMTPGTLAVRPKAETEKFDRATLNRDLASTFISGEYKAAS